MANLRGSQSFLWQIEKTLGQGATSMVYRGRNKSTGEEVAVKVFTQAGNLRPINVQTREYVVMQKLQHRNIVSLLGIEEETNTRNKIIVMELTDYGSLFNMLEQPDNAYGLPEEEFLIVLDNVAAGMQHLRESGVAHRDIKPGNILRFRGEDGKSIYKLTDFGAARELDEEEPFMSLYGTEEYLHPDMYERAVLRRPSGKQYTSKVDLWSLGVTFYHVCTGQLPFKAYGGRKNRDKMFQITRGKETGVISGIQHSKDGEVNWNRELPETCKLSLGLKQLVTPLLAGLLETDQHMVWSFDHFFEQVEKITTKVVVHVFCPLTWSNLRIYANKEDSYTAFQELIAGQTEIPSSHQLLIFDGQLFKDTVQPKLPINNYPRAICEKNPVFCFNDNYGDDDLWRFIPASVRDFPKFTSSQASEDYPVAKMCAGMACLIQKDIERYCLKQELVRRAVHLNIAELYHELLHLLDFHPPLDSIFQSSLKELDRFQRSMHRDHRLIRLHVSPSSPHVKWLQDLEDRTYTALQDLDTFAKQVSNDNASICADLYILQDEHLQKKALLKQWDDSCGCIESDRCVAKVDMILETVVKIRTRFQEDRKKALSFNEQQIHKFEKHKLSELCIKIRSLFMDHCEVQASQQFTQYREWYCLAQKCRSERNQMEKSLMKLQDNVGTFHIKLSEFFLHYDSQVSEGIRRIEGQETLQKEFRSMHLLSMTKQQPFDAHKTGDNENKLRELMPELLELVLNTREDIVSLQDTLRKNSEQLRSISLGSRTF